MNVNLRSHGQGINLIWCEIGLPQRLTERRNIRPQLDFLKESKERSGFFIHDRGFDLTSAICLICPEVADVKIHEPNAKLLSPFTQVLPPRVVPNSRSFPNSHCRLYLLFRAHFVGSSALKPAIPCSVLDYPIYTKTRRRDSTREAFSRGLIWID
jgi:hypothetical protein